MMEADMMGMPEYRPCVDEPLRDRPRLELATALDARWPERADYIRFEVWAHRKANFRERFAPIYRNDLARGLALDRTLEGRLEVPFGFKVDSYWRTRGLVESARLVGSVFLANEQSLFDCIPLLHLSLEGCAIEDLRRLQTTPRLTQLISLHVEAPGVGDDGLRLFLESAHLGNLKVLGFKNAGLTMRGYEMVAEATKTTLTGLELAFLSGNAIEDPEERPPSYDGISGAAVGETVGVLPPQGRCLEENLGYQKWLHSYSRFGESGSSKLERPLDMDETPIPDEVALGAPPTFFPNR